MSHPSLESPGLAWPPDTLVALLRSRALENAARPAFTFPVDVDETDPLTVTYADIDRRARAVAAQLQSATAAGARALILYPPSPEFAAAFFGALYAGLVAVPAYPLNPAQLQRTLPRLEMMIDDAQPAVALAPATLVPSLRELCAERGAAIRWIAVEGVPDALAAQWRDPGVQAASLAVIQYTSGSTSSPKGVMLSHRNVLSNLAMLQESCGTTSDSVFSSWLPLAHDMGLFGRLLEPIYVGARAILTAPELFVHRPMKWLALVARLGATCFGGPNFTYESCLRFATAESIRALDLQRWELASVGSEIAHAATMDRFAAAFAPAGFRREIFFNGYGLAEATLFVCGARDPRVLHLEKAALERHAVRTGEPGDATTTANVGAGRPPRGVRLAIVDPQTLAECRPGDIGEIWVAGDHVGLGYWNKPQDTAITFEAYTSDGREGPFLRTGDLGFLHDGELFVTGRLKDLIIIHGRNVYPRDLELTVEGCHPGLRIGCTAAFSVDEGAEQRLVILQELRHADDPDRDRIIPLIRERIADEHELLAHTVALLKPGGLLKTTSGKVQRTACRAAYRDGTLDIVVESTWNPAPAGDSPAAFVEPRTATEKKLAQIWMRVLDAERVGIHDNFLDLGGQSLHATQCIARVQRVFHVELQPSHFFSEAATVAEHALLIDDLQARRSDETERAATT